MRRLILIIMLGSAGCTQHDERQAGNPPVYGYLILNESAGREGLKPNDSLPELLLADVPTAVRRKADSLSRAVRGVPKCSRFFGRDPYVVLLTHECKLDEFVTDSWALALFNGDGTPVNDSTLFLRSAQYWCPQTRDTLGNSSSPPWTACVSDADR